MKIEDIDLKFLIELLRGSFVSTIFNIHHMNYSNINISFLWENIV